MDEKRKGEIALAVFRSVVGKIKLTMDPTEARKNLEKLSEKIGIPADELIAFYKEEAHIEVD
ncbi:hypothetical protein M0R01_03430 [bacterium]|nr:hypothetical protein [bacterium]